jgi:DNA-binding CsgD family transcriptional regulator
MKNVTELNHAQMQMCLYLTSGKSLKDTAAALKLSERTLYRYLEMSLVQSKIRNIRKVMMEHSIGRLMRLNDSAIDTLQRNLNCGNFAAEVRSANTIIRMNHDSLEYWNFDSRLALVESKFNDNEK